MNHEMWKGYLPMSLTLDEMHQRILHDGYIVLNTGTTDEWILELVCNYLGRIMAGPFWTKFTNINYSPDKYPMDVSGSEKSGVAKFAEKDFHLHIDGTFELTPPRYSILHCIQPDTEGFGVNVIVDGYSIVEQLSDHSRSALAQGLFEFRFELARNYFKSCANRLVLVTSPIIEMVGERIRIRYRNDDQFELKSVEESDELMQCLAEFEKLLHLPENQQSIYLRAGDVLIMDNYRLLHGRTSLSGQKERRLRRAWIS